MISDRRPAAQARVLIGITYNDPPVIAPHEVRTEDDAVPVVLKSLTLSNERLEDASAAEPGYGPGADVREV